MKQYQFQIVRYMHDQLAGEFANVGVVLYSPDEKFLACKVTTRYGRLSEFFGDINGQFLINTLRSFCKGIEALAFEINNKKNLPEASLEKLTHSLLPRDNSALQLTEVKWGRDIDLAHALEEWYDRLINRYNIDGEHSKSTTDAQAWSHVYKQFFLF